MFSEASLAILDGDVSRACDLMKLHYRWRADTPLMLCSKIGDREEAVRVARRLIEMGHDVNARVRRYNATHLACIWRNADLVRLLLENGARVDDRSYQECTALHTAVSHNDLECMSVLLAFGADTESMDGIGNTAMTKCYTNESIEMLVRAGADIDAQDDRGETILMKVACYRPALVRMFLEHGAEVDLQDKWGRTALMEAQKHYEYTYKYHDYFDKERRLATIECMDLLLEYGARQELEENSHCVIRVSVSESRTE